jgi:hypothetical protein
MAGGPALSDVLSPSTSLRINFVEGRRRREVTQGMKLKIEATTFGSITIDGREIENDVLLRLDGSVKKRKKKLSKKVYGTSHTISLDEAKYVY